MSLLEMSLSGAGMIVLITFIRSIPGNPLPRRIYPAFWYLVLLRLLTPLSIPAPINLSSRIITWEQTEYTLFTVPMSTLSGASHSPAFATAEAMTEATKHLQLFRQCIWLIGVFLIGAFFIRTYVRAVGNFRTSLPVSSDFIRRWLQEHPCRRSISVRQSDRISSPLTYGILHPVILLPKTIDPADEKQLHYIFLHEYVHICRFDCLTKLFLVTALCIHWMNPLVWLLYLLFNRDMELACDEAVLCKSHADVRADYARTLVTMEEQRAACALLFNNFKYNTMKERIVAIMKPKKLTLRGGLLAVVLVLCLGTVFLTSAQAASDKQPGSPLTTATTNVASEAPGTTNITNTADADGTDVSADSQFLLQWTWPTESTRLTLSFGTVTNPLTGLTRTSDHICIAGETGDAVYAAHTGTVTEADFSAEYGNYVILTQENVHTLYGHLDTTNVQVGDTISGGEAIGTLGASGMATGPNLAFSVFQDGEAVDPISLY